MEKIIALGLGTNIVLGGIAGILIGASYSLFQKIQATLASGQGLKDALRQHGLFIAILSMLWITLLSYAYLKIQSVAPTPQAIQQPIE